MTVTEALRARTSIREFLSEPLSGALVREILDVARWSPSGGNLQPWKVIAVAGAERDAVVELAKRTLLENPSASEASEYPIYPEKLWDPYRSRRYDLGEQMYELLGIPREDKMARLGRFARNYEFFGAPVGLFFVIDRRMGHGQWAHLGMFMQSIALAAVERGVGSCMQEAWGAVRQTLGRHFSLPENEVLYCGMALGRPDAGAAVNRLRSSRAEVSEFATFRGF
ncbi:MAG TPA: nitroreductase [Polyangiaceae bacterium]|nr:nitroreductase [Polyangiaceae bacterium]